MVELIIVIAIMAVIMSILAPQFLRYIEKSKQGKDADVAGVVHRAVCAAMADTSIDDRPVGGYGIFGTDKYLKDIEDGTMPHFANEIKESLGVSDLTSFEDNAFSSNAYKGSNMKIEIDATSQHVTIMVTSKIASVENILIK